MEGHGDLPHGIIRMHEEVMASRGAINDETRSAERSEYLPGIYSRQAVRHAATVIVRKLIQMHFWVTKQQSSLSSSHR